MASDEENVYVKVRAKLQKGFWRAGLHWPPEDTFARVTEEQAKQLEQEPALYFLRVSRGDVPADKRDAADFEADQRDPNKQKPEARVPEPPPEGPTTPLQASPTQVLRPPAPDPALDLPPNTAEPGAGPKHDEEPKTETVFGSSSQFGSSETSKKKR